MSEIINTLMKNLEYIGACLLLLAFFRAADILLGIALSHKSSIPFNIKKLFRGLMFTACALGGTAALALGMSAAVPIITYCNVITDDSLTQTLDTLNITSLCSMLIFISVKTYGTDALKKFKQFFTK